MSVSEPSFAEDSVRAKSFLITGGSGFIGTHLVHALLRAGATVWNLDTRPPKISAQNDHWIEADLSDADKVAAVIHDKRPDVVMNLAAETDIRKGAAAFAVNTTGLSNLIEACLKHVPSAQLVHFSTQLTVSAGYTPANDEDMDPYGAYGESKADSERLLRREAGGLRWTIVRPTTIWGPHHPSFGQGIWKYLRKRYYMAPGSRAAIRAYGYVDNLVEQVINIPQVPAEAVDGQIFYVGDAPIPSTQWLDAFSISLSGKPVRRFPYGLLWMLAAAGEGLGRIGGPSPINFGRLERMSTDHTVPMEKTFSVLGKGSVSLPEGVKRTVAWLGENA